MATHSEVHSTTGAAKCVIHPSMLRSQHLLLEADKDIMKICEKQAPARLCVHEHTAEPPAPTQQLPI